MLMVVVFADGCLFEVEGILEVPTNSLPGEVCFQVPICIDGENCIGEFCVQLTPCEPECDFANVQETITYLSENLYEVDIDAIISNPNEDKINVQIYSKTGQFSNTFSPYTSYDDPVVIPTYNTNWNSSGNFLCYKVLIKNKTTGEKCTENICTPIPEANFGNHQRAFREMVDEDDLEVSDRVLAVKSFPFLVRNTLYIESKHSKNLDYRIITSSGLVKLEGALLAISQNQIDVSALQSGIYFIQVKERKTSRFQNFKFVVAR